MWETRASARSNATPEQVWELWTDVAGWPTWDHEVEHAEIKGPFERGSVGVLKPKGGPRSAFIMTEATVHRSFSDRSRLPLATLEFHHTVTPNGDGVVIEHRVAMSGPLTPLFRRVLGGRIARGLPVAVEALARRAETVPR